MGIMHDDADTITIAWHIDDVLSVRPDLTCQHARTVLAHAKHNHDAEIGINWIVLATIADGLFPDAHEASEQPAGEGGR